MKPVRFNTALMINTVFWGLIDGLVGYYDNRYPLAFFQWPLNIPKCRFAFQVTMIYKCPVMDWVRVETARVPQVEVSCQMWSIAAFSVFDHICSAYLGEGGKFFAFIIAAAETHTVELYRVTDYLINPGWLYSISELRIFLIVKKILL